MGLRFIFVLCQFHAALPGVFRVRSQFRHVAIGLFGPFRIGVVLGLPERPEIVRLVTLVSAFLFSVGIPCSSILSLSSKAFTGLLMPHFQCGECRE